MARFFARPGAAYASSVPARSVDALRSALQGPWALACAANLGQVADALNDEEPSREGGAGGLVRGSESAVNPLT